MQKNAGIKAGCMD